MAGESEYFLAEVACGGSTPSLRESLLVGLLDQRVEGCCIHLFDPVAPRPTGTGSAGSSGNGERTLGRLVHSAVLSSPCVASCLSLVSRAGGQATSAQLRAPLGVAPDGLGGLFIADCEGGSIAAAASISPLPHPAPSPPQRPTNHAIRFVSSAGVITTVAGNLGERAEGNERPRACASRGLYLPRPQGSRGSRETAFSPLLRPPASALR